mgnify:CR=1 FL=1
MKKFIKNLILFIILFYLILLSLRSLTTLLLILFDNYYLELDNARGFSDKEFNFYLINAIVPDVLTIIFAILLMIKSKVSKLILSLAVIIAIFIFKITYLNVFSIFIFFNSPILNLIILFFISLIAIFILVKKDLRT